MSESIREHTRHLLAQSLPLVRQHRDEIITRVELNLRGVVEDTEPFGQTEVVAMVLTDLLIKQAGAIVFTGETIGLDTIAEEHGSLMIEGRHYSRFGDGLVPILRDVLGARLPKEVASAWCDIFWHIIRSTNSDVAFAHT